MNEPLEKMLDDTVMGGYDFYTREDVIEFAKLAVEECLYIVDIPQYERNMIRQAFGMKEKPMPVRDIGLVTTRDWTK